MPSDLQHVQCGPARGNARSTARGSVRPWGSPESDAPSVQSLLAVTRRVASPWPPDAHRIVGFTEASPAPLSQPRRTSLWSTSRPQAPPRSAGSAPCRPQRPAPRQDTPPPASRREPRPLRRSPTDGQRCGGRPAQARHRGSPQRPGSIAPARRRRPRPTCALAQFV
eukprot:Amastigsp_a682106_9.p3 type:complete len:167 gc:universal Amastigsp_a682106_9:871-371(-)